jgi:hypothetical protein
VSGGRRRRLLALCLADSGSRVRVVEARAWTSRRHPAWHNPQPPTRPPATAADRSAGARGTSSRRRKSRDSDDELEGGQAAPLVLLHGVGMGLLPYLGLLAGLKAAGHPLLAPQWRHVSMRLCLSVPTVDEVGRWRCLPACMHACLTCPCCRRALRWGFGRPRPKTMLACPAG